MTRLIFEEAFSGRSVHSDYCSVNLSTCSKVLLKCAQSWYIIDNPCQIELHFRRVRVAVFNLQVKSRYFDPPSI